MTYLRGFQLVRIFFQPERTETAFNSGELCLILASIDFVGTNQKLREIIIRVYDKLLFIKQIICFGTSIKAKT